MINTALPRPTIGKLPHGCPPHGEATVALILLAVALTLWQATTFILTALLD